MALDVQRISLDISKQPTPQQVRLGQGDANATRLIIDVFDDGIAYSLTNYNVRLSMHLPNEGGYYQVNGTKSGNTATFDIDERYAATTYGFDGFGYVDILNGDTVICSTSRFQLVVLRNAADGVELSEQYINAVEDAVNRANEAAEAAEGIVLQAVPTMSANIKGGAKLGSGLAVSNDTLSVNASTVASGTLPIARGGTGATSAANALTSLGAVAKSGDTMTGSLYLDDGAYYHKRIASIDTTSTPSTSVTENPFRVMDASGIFIGQLRSVHDTEGNISFRLVARQGTTTSGGIKQASLGVGISPAGAVSYTVSTPEAFCSAIHVGDYVGKDQTTNVSMANGTYSNLCSINLTAGTWIVTGQLNWATNGTGRRHAYISTSSQSSHSARSVVNEAQSNTQTAQNVSGPILLADTQTVYLVGWQNSGAALNATGYLRAVRIK